VVHSSRAPVDASVDQTGARNDKNKTAFGVSDRSVLAASTASNQPRITRRSSAVAALLQAARAWITRPVVGAISTVTRHWPRKRTDTIADMPSAHDAAAGAAFRNADSLGLLSLWTRLCHRCRSLFLLRHAAPLVGHRVQDGGPDWRSCFLLRQACRSGVGSRRPSRSFLVLNVGSGDNRQPNQLRLPVISPRRLRDADPDAGSSRASWRRNRFQ